MSSKGLDPTEAKVGEVKLAPGWMSLGRKTRTGAAPTVSPLSVALPRVRISKAEMLEVYEPGAPPGLPPVMNSHIGITCVDSLVPINIAPDDELLTLMAAQSTSSRTIPRGSPSRSTSSLSRHRLGPASPPAANGRSRVGADESDRSGNFELSSLHSASAHKNGANNSFVPLGSANPSSHSGGHSNPAHGPGSTIVTLSSSYNESGSQNINSTVVGGTPKRSGLVSSNRDFWSNSSSLATVERSATSGPVSSERRPLALKPRSAHLLQSDAAGGGSQNGPNSDHQNRPSQQGTSSYWTRSAARGGADGNANWRGGSANNPGGNDGTSQTGNQSTSNSKNGAIGANTNSALHSSRGVFARDSGREPFSRNKEALKPTNTRDLSALAKGSTRDTSGTLSGGNSAHFSNREKEYRTAGSSFSSTATESRVQSKQPDIMSDARNVWYYKDPRGDVQGPFSAAKVMHWLKEGYYDDNLEISRNPETGFRPLAIVFGLRKEQISTAAPPGFIPGSGGLPSSPDERPTVVDRPEPVQSIEQESSEERETGRELHSEPKKLTVKEMEEEVEKMRLENHRKKHMQKQKEAQTGDVNSRRNGPVQPRVGFFDGEKKPVTTEALEDTSASGFMTDTQSDSLHASVEDRSTSSAVFGIRPSDGLLSKKEVQPGKLEVSPLVESRFASLMAAPKVNTSQAVERSGKPLANDARVSDIRTEIALNQGTVTDAVDELRSDIAGPAQSPQPLIAELSKKDSTQPINATQSSQSLWGSGMMDSQQRIQSSGPVTSSVPLTVSGHDLMAMDPAIARASFTRRPAESSNPSHSQPRSWVDPNVSAEPTTTTQKSHVSSLQSLDGPGIGHLPISMNAGSGFGGHNSSTSISMAEVQAQALAHAQVQAQNAHAQARARAHAQAQVQVAQAQAARAHAQAAHVQAQARARAAQQAAQVQTQVRVQNQSAVPSQSNAQNPDPLWVFRHQLAQLQTGWDLHCRGRMEASRSLQHGRQAVNGATPGSIEHRQAEAFCANCEAVIQEHTLNMERIKAAAQTAHAQMLRHQQQQQLLSQQEQILSQQRANVPTAHTSQNVQEPSQAELSPKTDEVEPRSSDPDVERLTSSVAAADLGGRGDGPSSAPPKPSTPSPPVTTGIQAASEKGAVGPANKINERNTSGPPVRMAQKSMPSLNDSDESGWETVERKTRAGNEEQPSKGSADESKSDIRIERPPVTLVTSVVEPARGPVDSHVLVVPADKDPRKLAENSSDLNQREEEQDDSDSFRRKVSSIPAPWIKAAQPGQQNGPSLREIQRQEELRSKAQMDSLAQAQREQAARLAAARQAAASNVPWGSAASKQRALSLREQMRLEEEQKQRNANRSMQSANTTTHPRATRAATAQPASRPAWASLVASNKPSQVRQAAIVVGKRMEDEGTFWESVGSSSRKVSSATAPVTSGGSRQNTSRAAVNRPVNVPPRATRAVQAAVPQTSQTTMKNQSVVEATNIQGRIGSEMAKWCCQQLRGITGEASDDNTFAEYLASLKSDDDIRDTVLQNLGASDNSRAFAEEFIRRLAFERLGDAGEQGAVGVGGGRKRGKKGNRKMIWKNFQ